MYADVLIFLNTFVNFFILMVTSKLCKDGFKLYRMVIAALTGAAFSLYIFLPSSPPVIEILFKLTISAVIVIICFGFDSVKSLVRRIVVFFLASFLYGGAMLAIWFMLKPENMAINNGIVYLDISPVILILTTLLSYVTISVIRFFSKKQANVGKRCCLKIETESKTVRTTALLDTGNSLCDNVTGNSVIIIEKSVAQNLLGFLPTLENVSEYSGQNIKFRILPFSTVGNKGLIIAFKPKCIKVETKESFAEFTNILVAISNTSLGEDYKAIINPDLLYQEI